MSITGYFALSDIAKLISTEVSSANYTSQFGHLRFLGSIDIKGFLWWHILKDKF